MKRIVFITPSDAEYGFKLAGVTQYVAGRAEVEEVLDNLMADPDNGVIVVDERLVMGIDEKKMKGLEERWYGIFLVLPAPEKPALEVDYAMRLIKRAIGYHIRVT